MIKSTDAITRKLQADSTKRLKERLHDTIFWKQELEREINDIIQETTFLIKEKDRLQNVLLETDLPLQIATENLNTRERRRGIDKVADPVESELYIVSFSTFLVKIVNYLSIRAKYRRTNVNVFLSVLKHSKEFFSKI